MSDTHFHQRTRQSTTACMQILAPCWLQLLVLLCLAHLVVRQAPDDAAECQQALVDVASLHRMKGPLSLRCRTGCLRHACAVMHGRGALAAKLADPYLLDPQFLCFACVSAVCCTLTAC